MSQILGRGHIKHQAYKETKCPLMALKLLFYQDSQVHQGRQETEMRTVCPSSGKHVPSRKYPCAIHIHTYIYTQLVYAFIEYISAAVIHCAAVFPNSFGHPFSYTSTSDPASSACHILKTSFHSTMTWGSLHQPLLLLTTLLARCCLYIQCTYTEIKKHSDIREMSHV